MAGIEKVLVYFPWLFKTQNGTFEGHLDDLCTLESGINIRGRLLTSEVFSRGYVLIKGTTFINYGFLKNFLRLFNFLFFWLCTKYPNYLLCKRGLRLFKGLCLLFLTNVPGAMFIQGGTFIPDSRVH